MASSDAGIVLDPQVVNPGPCQRHVRVVLGVETCPHRAALRCRPDIDRAAARREGADQARFQRACLCRDATPVTGLRDGPARSPATLACHVKMRVTAVTLAKLDARQQADDQLTAFSMARLKRRSVHPHLMDRMLTI